MSNVKRLFDLVAINFKILSTLYKVVNKSGGGWAWVRLGKIKCAANCFGLSLALQLF